MSYSKLDLELADLLQITPRRWARHLDADDSR